jgi:hypothetical protein
MTNDDFLTVFSGGATMAHPIGIAALLICCSLILFSKKETVVPAILVLVFIIPSAQRVVVFSLDFSFLRIAILSALLRMWIKGEGRQAKLVYSDNILMLWMLWSVVSYGFLFESFGSAVARAGYMIEAVGAYFVGRFYVSSWAGVKRVVLFIGYSAMPILVLFLVERTTGRNMFSIFGGIGEFTFIRDGSMRCQGPFSHPIMAGLFWASILPWFAVVWVRQEIPKLRLVFIAVSILFIIINTASSTPLMAVILSFAGIILFYFRRGLPLLRLLALFVLFLAELTMEKGAAHLLSRINVVSGSTGWYRYYLIDEAKKHFGEWWLVGIKSTAHWGAEILPIVDITNQYILEGIRGGVLSLILFFLFLISMFKLIGKALRASAADSDRWIYWGGGVVLFVHAISFLSVSYFGQMVASFFIFSGMTVGFTAGYLQNKSEPYTVPLKVAA